MTKFAREGDLTLVEEKLAMVLMLMQEMNRTARRACIVPACLNGNMDISNFSHFQGCQTECQGLLWVQYYHIFKILKWATIQRLVQRGAELDPKDRSGMTPLNWAFLHEYVDTVKLLVEKERTFMSKTMINGHRCIKPVTLEISTLPSC